MGLAEVLVVQAEVLEVLLVALVAVSVVDLVASVD